MSSSVFRARMANSRSEISKISHTAEAKPLESPKSATSEKSRRLSKIRRFISFAALLVKVKAKICTKAFGCCGSRNAVAKYSAAKRKVLPAPALALKTLRDLVRIGKEAIP